MRAPRFNRCTAIQDEVRRVRGHTSVFAFMLADEPDWKSKDPAIIKRAHETVKSEDTSRPTVVCLGSAPSYQSSCVRSPFRGHFECIDWKAYLDTADVISSDPYPITQRFMDGTFDDGIPPPNISVAADVMHDISARLRPNQA